MGVFIFLGIIVVILFLLFLNVNNGNKTNTHTEEKVSEEYDYLEERMREQYKENAMWEKEWERIRIPANKALDYEQKNEIEKALEKHLEAYEIGHNSEILNICNYSYNIDRAIVLYGKLKREDELKSFLEKVISQYPNDRSAKDWIVRFTKLNSKNIAEKDNYDTTLDDEIISNVSGVGKKIEELKDSFPEFDFYYKKGVEESTIFYFSNNIAIDRNKIANLQKYRDAIDILIKKGRVFENTKEYGRAIHLYHRIINEQIDNKEPYKRLMIIYRKLKEKEKEIQIIRDAISFFETLRENQKKYTLGLARKYGEEDFALSYINNNKRIQYYNGMFDLYNPNTDIEKWKERLNKLLIK